MGRILPTIPKPPEDRDETPQERLRRTQEDWDRSALTGAQPIHMIPRPAKIREFEDSGVDVFYKDKRRD